MYSLLHIIFVLASKQFWLFIVFLIFYPLFIYFSLWLCIRGFRAYFLMRNSTQWLATTGTLLDTRIVYNNIANAGNYNFDFVIVKKYKYTIDGQTYIANSDLPSDHIFINEYNSMAHFAGHYGDYTQEIGYQTAKNQLKNLKSKKLTVYYDPKNPKQACLRKGVKGSIYVTIGMGCFLFLLLLILGIEIIPKMISTISLA